MNYSTTKARKANGEFTFKSRIVRAYRWTMHKIKWGLVIGAAAFAFSLVGFLYSNAYAANTMTVVNQIIETPSPKASMSAVMARIADCESGIRLPNGRAVPGSAKQFNKDGSVVTHENADGTTDVGKYEINMQKEHIVNLARLHLDVMTEAGNEAYAKWIYENIGTGPWYSSRSCWQ